MPLVKPDYSFRRMLRANRLLSELGHKDVNAALEELKVLREAAKYAESVFRAHNECRDHSLGMEKAVERLAAALANTEVSNAAGTTTRQL